MRRLIPLTIAAALIAAIVPAAVAAKPTPYEGRTSGGHDVTFELSGRMMNEFVTGVPMQCISIQGGGSPVSGVELWDFDRVRLGLKEFKFSELSKPSLHYNEVTRNHTITTRRERKGAITGTIRVQYSFMIPKFPIGTFSIYSCLGTTEFRAKPTVKPGRQGKRARSRGGTR